MNCQEVPSILATEPSKSACERLAAAKPACICESCSVEPTLSPGTVDAGETLARFVLALDFDDECKVVKPSLFSHAGTNGMSVTRVEHAGAAGLERQQRSKNYLGYVDASCRAVRSILNEVEQAFGVYDTALIDNHAHADVCQSVFRPNSVKTALRRRLMLVFSQTLKSAIE